MVLQALTACYMPCKTRNAPAPPPRPTSPDRHLSLLSQATSCSVSPFRVRHSGSTVAGSLAGREFMARPCSFLGGGGGGWVAQLFCVVEDPQEAPGRRLFLSLFSHFWASLSPRSIFPENICITAAGVFKVHDL